MLIDQREERDPIPVMKLALDTRYPTTLGREKEEEVSFVI